MNLPILEQLPAWYYARYGHPPRKVDVDSALNWADRALRQIRRPAQREFEGRGFTIRVTDLSWPTPMASGRIRARLNLRLKELLIDSLAEADIHQSLEHLGFPLSPSPLELMLTHELFHLFCPRCPVALAELSAHLFTGRALGLEYFPGLIDIVESFPQKQIHTA